ncbi:hypothetical protein ACPZ19_48745 [Amycolatopsis lurida]
MSKLLRATSVLCLFAGVALIIVFLSIRPGKPRPILYQDTPVVVANPGDPCPTTAWP